MKYEHGTGCWQGPSRSTTVSLLTQSSPLVPSRRCLSSSTCNRCDCAFCRSSWFVGKRPRWLPPRSPVDASTWWSSSLRLPARTRRATTCTTWSTRSSRASWCVCVWVSDVSLLLVRQELERTVRRECSQPEGLESNKQSYTISSRHIYDGEMFVLNVIFFRVWFFIPVSCQIKVAPYIKVYSSCLRFPSGATEWL